MKREFVFVERYCNLDLVAALCELLFLKVYPWELKEIDREREFVFGVWRDFNVGEKLARGLV